jgi:hypothetical protein
MLGAEGAVVTDRATAARLPLGWVTRELDDGRVAILDVDEGMRARSGTPFIGRDAELRVGRDVVADVVAGRGRVLLVEGDAGLGKTRFLEELRTDSTDLRWLDAAVAFAPGDGPLAEDTHEVTANAPLGLVVDDVQRLGGEERVAVADLLAATDAFPLLVVLSLDPAVAEDVRDLWGTALTDYRHRVAHVTMAPLPDEDAAVLADALSSTGALDRGTKEELVARAEGNPLYLEELIRSLSESGGLTRGSGWTLSMTSSWMMLPPSLESLLAGRIQRLPESPRHLAQIAAVVGREFPVPMVEEVVGADVGADLSVLLHAEIVREVRRIPELVCVFRHRMLQDAALATLTPDRMRELYGKVGHAYEEHSGKRDTATIERLAFYFYRSNDDATALWYLEQAVAAVKGARRKELQARADKLRERIHGA